MTADNEGGVAITLAGKTFTMTPSFQAAVAIETESNQSLVELAARVVEGRGKFADYAAVITAGLTAAGEPATPEKVGVMVYETGLQHFRRPTLEYFAMLLNGGRPLVPDGGADLDTTRDSNETAQPEGEA